MIAPLLMTATTVIVAFLSLTSCAVGQVIDDEGLSLLQSRVELEGGLDASQKQDQHFKVVARLARDVAEMSHVDDIAESIFDVEATPITCEHKTVFDVGLPRTGTTSVSLFMQSLGYKSHHILKPTFQEFISCKQNTSACGFYAFGHDSQVAFEDVPTFGLACPLMAQFPEARFILTTRSFDDYSDSVRLMMCKWVLPDCGSLKTSDHLKIQTDIYGDAFEAFCHHAPNHPSLCGDQDPSLASDTWEKIGLKRQWHKVWEQHDAEVRGCIPAKRLLELPLGSSKNANNIHRFLGCSGTVPEFPHEHFHSFTSTVAHHDLQMRAGHYHDAEHHDYHDIEFDAPLPGTLPTRMHGEFEH